MDAAAVAHDDVVMPRREMQVLGLAAGWDDHSKVLFTDTDAEWFKCIPCKVLDNQEATARVVLIFARAYLAALISGQDDPVFDTEGDVTRVTPAALLQDIQGCANVEGQVPMGSIIASFWKCPGRIFCQTLTLLTWAGHIGSFNTLARYKYTLATVVDAYWENKEMIFRSNPSDFKVWTRCPSVLRFAFFRVSFEKNTLSTAFSILT